MKKLKDISLIVWDVEGTLFVADALKTKKANDVVRANCLSLLRSEPILELQVGVKEILQYAHSSQISQGIVSDFAYQFAINYLSASEAREFIDPDLIFLAHKFAWEGMILDKKNYEEVLAEYKKPQPKMLNLALEKTQEKITRRISSNQCLFIGDQEIDEKTATLANWRFLYIGEILNGL
jgi:phosphoglycolate phosphatase-like HAD superfamily hydrolase